ncbi:succinate dehydrogenase, hydrophobic membrane anchor protein [Bermanella marisrubri]|uniref:Succinate dehydrogenase hydrophobic membrane anchor subunit n=1 Tax=Bermanella marisrubri TaxID=207949 RepID=Q1N6I3_9GAMM|nr:succinate dehydrogenase, hydrophobic membrane anchor protein [Bermanella marisrubri]EAT13609.1 succinate dehydrogenase, hydrophobic membrane anchor protein [Oceanobacter sp. RED65] [Bermanella marisrubri]QIZ84397.1 succinate dehydrogenase, hydrophobic membrane anchor protein [Bermanella marisrubri]
MGVSVTNFSRSGLSDWLIQRVSAVILALYTVFIVGFLLANPDLDYAQWKEFFSSNAVRIFSLLALISTVAHAWIGMWTVATDYFKPVSIRFVFQVACFLALFVYLVWGIEIIWGV